MITQNFSTWLEVFLDEKGVDVEQVYEIVHEEVGLNIISIACVVEYVCQLPTSMQQQIKSTFVQIDFRNGDVHHFLKHIAAGMVEAYAG